MTPFSRILGVRPWGARIAAALIAMAISASSALAATTSVHFEGDQQRFQVRIAGNAAGTLNGSGRYVQRQDLGFAGCLTVATVNFTVPNSPVNLTFSNLPQTVVTRPKGDINFNFDNQTGIPDGPGSLNSVSLNILNGSTVPLNGNTVNVPISASIGILGTLNGTLTLTPTGNINNLTYNSTAPGDQDAAFWTAPGNIGGGGLVQTGVSASFSVLGIPLNFSFGTQTLLNDSNAFALAFNLFGGSQQRDLQQGMSVYPHDYRVHWILPDLGIPVDIAEPVALALTQNFSCGSCGSCLERINVNVNATLNVNLSQIQYNLEGATRDVLVAPPSPPVHRWWNTERHLPTIVAGNSAGWGPDSAFTAGTGAAAALIPFTTADTSWLIGSNNPAWISGADNSVPGVGRVSVNPAAAGQDLVQGPFGDIALHTQNVNSRTTVEWEVPAGVDEVYLSGIVWDADADVNNQVFTINQYTSGGALVGGGPLLTSNIDRRNLRASPMSFVVPTPDILTGTWPTLPVAQGQLIQFQLQRSSVSDLMGIEFHVVKIPEETPSPTPSPSASPSPSPSPSPTRSPSPSPSRSPSPSPSVSPTRSPSPSPSASPSSSPSPSPTSSPSASPSASPSPSPTESPTASPTESPSPSPTESPTASPSPTPTGPTPSPTESPTASPSPTPNAVDDWMIYE